jgi:uncharacterized protein
MKTDTPLPSLSDAQLKDAAVCPHRVALDLRGDQSRRGPQSSFTQMLWADAAAITADQLARLGKPLDLSIVPERTRGDATLQALRGGADLVYGGMLAADGLLASPTLLERSGGGYVAGTIRSGSADGEGLDRAVLGLTHAASLLERMGFGTGSRTVFLIDRNGERTNIDLDAPRGIKTPESSWERYEAALDTVGRIVDGKPTKPALGAQCKLCPWRDACMEEVVRTNDLSLIAELGRSKRDVLQAAFPTVKALAEADLGPFIVNVGKRVEKLKTVFPGIGVETLKRFQARARLLSTPNARPYIKGPVSLRAAAREVMFDLEDDPLGGIVYLHGFVERLTGRPETARYIPFFADAATEDAERDTFAKAWGYLRERLADSTIYFYSKYERTKFLDLAARFPSVASVEEVAAAFDSDAMVDLYSDVVRPSTEWPTHDLSIKTLAVYLGFSWRDSNPSGASSIEWYRAWLATGDVAIRKRIVEYNEDDTLATAIVLDGVKAMVAEAAETSFPELSVAV